MDAYEEFLISLNYGEYAMAAILFPTVYKSIGALPLDTLINPEFVEAMIGTIEHPQWLCYYMGMIIDAARVEIQVNDDARLNRAVHTVALLARASAEMGSLADTQHIRQNARQPGWYGDINLRFLRAIESASQKERSPSPMSSPPPSKRGGPG